MSDWVLVPCLVTLRTEFNAVSPGRDKGADGSIGDSAHTSSSDHTPDEDSDILRDHDADHKNEVHALDIDSSGPWPEGFHFVARVRALKEREFSRGSKSRLQYVICNGQIANIDVQGGRWRNYPGTDPHTNHAHFSARYTTAQEQDTSPWGVSDGIEANVALNDEKITLTADTAKEIGKKPGDEVTGATLLQLAVIYAARGDDKADVAQKVSQANAGAIDQISKTVAEIAKMLGMTPGSTDAEVAAALRAALGDRAVTVGALLTSAK